VEVQEFESFQGDASWMNSKKKQPSVAKKAAFQLSSQQRLLYDQVKGFALGPRAIENVAFDWTAMKAQDRSFMLKLIANLGLKHDLSVEEGFTQLIVEWNSDDEESDEESWEARHRVLKKYDSAHTEKELSQEEQAELKENAYKAQFEEWKWEYYRENLEIAHKDQSRVDKVVYSYVEGLQWVLLYYYRGVPSWEWFYPYHYAPKISDLMSIDDLEFNFELGKPFFPFEQLMAVLPPLSRQHVPPCLQDLMTDPHSPIIDFYPLKFELDKSGKKADWEAIVKIPFIEEKRLLSAVRGRNHMYSKDEKKRNSLGDANLFEFTPDLSVFPSPLPNVFPDITQCLCQSVPFKVPKLPPSALLNHLCPGGRIGKDLLAGFPSMDTIPHTFTIGHHGVNLFNSESKNPTVVISIQNIHEGKSPEDLASELIGKNVFTGWPFLIESKVMALSDELFVYTVSKAKNGKPFVVKTPHDENSGKRHFLSAEKADLFYSKRCGVLIGEIEIVVKVQVLKGLQLLNDGSFVKEFAPKGEFDIPIQLVVTGSYEDPRFRNIRAPKVTHEFPTGSPVFFLAPKLYGVLGEVLEHQEGSKDTLDLCVQRFVTAELNQELTVCKAIATEEVRKTKYLPGWQLAKQLKISSLGLSRLTSAFLVEIAGTDRRVNLGLNLKYDHRSQKALGYTQKTANGWEYSPKALELLKAYRDKFPSIFNRLQTKSDGDFYQDIDFFPRNPAEGVEAVKAWLKEQGLNKIVTVPNNSLSLSKVCQYN
jgi:5'-3' exoribonuclease 1